jgi:hypothetical protein
MPFSYSPSAADTGTGTFTVFARNIVTDDIVEDAEGAFKPSLVTLSITGRVVPEPSTWGMMLVGFAGLGFAGYRARRSALST